MTNMNGRPCGSRPHPGAGENTPAKEHPGALDLNALKGVPLAECFRACASGALRDVAGMTVPLQAVGDQVRALRAVLAELDRFKRARYERTEDPKDAAMSPAERAANGLLRDLTSIEAALHAAHAVARFVVNGVDHD